MAFPKVSVVMAVYNKAPYLPQSIDSVLNQTFGDFELICIDADSTDESYKILQEYAEKDNRIRIYKTPFTPVPAVTKNFGIDQSKGQYVFNLDADDYLSLDALEKMHTVATQTRAQAVIPDLQTISANGEYLIPLIIGLNGDHNILISNRQAVTESLDWSVHGFGFWDGNLMRKIRFEEFGSYSDEFSTRILFFNCQKIAFSEGLYYHRINDQSITGKISLQMYDRPSALYKLAVFLEEQKFDEADINGMHFSAFKDCCFLLHMIKNLDSSQVSEAEDRIKKVHNLVNKERVRKGAFARVPGRAALWKAEGKAKKYVFGIIASLSWGQLKRVPFKLLF